MRVDRDRQASMAGCARLESSSAVTRAEHLGVSHTAPPTLVPLPRIPDTRRLRRHWSGWSADPWHHFRSAGNIWHRFSGPNEPIRPQGPGLCGPFVEIVGPSALDAGHNQRIRSATSDRETRCLRQYGGAPTRAGTPRRPPGRFPPTVESFRRAPSALLPNVTLCAVPLRQRTAKVFPSASF